MTTKDICFFVAKGFQPLDLAGPMAVFATANDYAPSAYRLITVGISSDGVEPVSGPTIIPDESIYNVGQPHTIVLVGGAGPRTLELEENNAERLRELCHLANRVVTICTGAFIAGRLGLLDGRNTITHWNPQKELERLFPKARVVEDELYSKDEELWCSAGVTAGIDTCLAIVREDFGDSVAANVARHLVVYLQRPGEVGQFSAAIQSQTRSDTRLASVIHWIQDNLDGDLTLPILAKHSSMSERHLQRKFKACFGISVSKFVEKLRVERAKDILSVANASIAVTAQTVGFKSSDSFRRAFERQTGISPNFYVKRYSNEKK